MKYVLPFICVIILVQSCANQATQEHAEASLELSDLKKDFKYNNLKAFRIDDHAWGSRSKYYKELDSQTFYLIWKDAARVFNKEGYDKGYLFSWQERDVNFQECTILTESEADHGPIIEYCIFDKNGKSVDHFTVAARSDDGGRYYESYGMFIKPDVYALTSVEQVFVSMDSVTQKELYKGDTTIQHYSIGKNGKVSREQVYKRPFLSRE